MIKTKSPEKLLAEAIEDGRSRNYQTALKKLKEVLVLTDSLPEAFLYTGRANHALGNLEAAVTAYKFYIDKVPESGAGYFYLGRTYIALDNFVQASICFAESIQYNNGFAPAYAYYGYSLVRRGKFRTALRYLEQAVNLDPVDRSIYTMYVNAVFIASVDAFRKEDFDYALSGFLFLNDSDNSNLSTLLYTGIILKDSGKADEAADFLQMASEYAPDDNEIKSLLAEALFLSGQIEEGDHVLSSFMTPAEKNNFISNISNLEDILAVSYYKRNEYKSAFHFAIKSLKKGITENMHLLAGDCMLKSGNIEIAYNHFTRALEINRKSSGAMQGRAASLWLLRDYSNMKKEITAILKINPSDEFAEYYKPLCSYYLKEPESEWKFAIEQRIKKNPDHWYCTVLGEYYLKQGKDPGKAEKLFKKAVAAKPDHKEAWDGLLLIHHNSFDNNTAKILSDYLRVYRSDQQIREKLVHIYIKNVNFKQAITELEIISAEQSTNVKIIRQLAYCNRMCKNYREAAILYRRILQTFPDDENILKNLVYCYRRSGNEVQAGLLLAAAIDYLPKPGTDLFLTYGVSLYRLGKPEEALTIFQKCLYSGHRDWRLFRNMGIIYREKGLKDYSKMYFSKAEEMKKR